MNVLLLSTQLIDQTIISNILKKITGTSDFKLTLYDSPSFYEVNKIPVSSVKKKYFKDCLQNYTKHQSCTVINDLNKLHMNTYYYFEFMDFSLEEELRIVKKRSL